MPFDLVFSGGGTRGVALSGAMEVLEKKLPIVRRVVGASAGAIASVFGAAGFLTRDYLKLIPMQAGDPFVFSSFFGPPSADDVREAVRRKDSETRKLLRHAFDGATDKMLEKLGERRPRIAEILKGFLAAGKDGFYEAAFEGFLDRLAARDNDPAKPHKYRAAVFALLEFGGIFDPKPFYTWLNERLRPRLPNFDRTTTFQDFHALTKGVGRELSVVVSDTATAKPLVLNHRTAPRCPVAEAILMSMSVPFIWPEVQWQRSWGEYLGQDIVGHAIVDGGVLANLPIKYVVDQNNEDVKLVMGPPAAKPNIVVALLLNASLPVPGDVPHDDKLNLKLFERVNRLLDTMSAWQYDSLKSYEELVCHIPCMGHPPLEMAPTPAAIDRLQALVNSGRCAMTEYLQRRKL